MICIQETWLKKHFNFVIQGYVAVRRDRGVGNGGGVATFVQQGIGFRTVQVNKEFESLVVEVWAESVFG